MFMKKVKKAPERHKDVIVALTWRLSMFYAFHQS